MAAPKNYNFFCPSFPTLTGRVALVGSLEYMLERLFLLGADSLLFAGGNLIIYDASANMMFC